jgi:SOS-response transcriptional repressor LexA
MAVNPTRRNMEIFAYCREFLKENDEFPPMWAVAKHFGFNSLNAAQCHIEALARHGLIERNSIGNWRFTRY